MNPRVEKLLKLPLWKRLAMLAAVILVVLGLFVWFVGLPAYDELTALKQEAQTLDAEIAQKRLVANNLDKFKEEFANLEAKLASPRCTRRCTVLTALRYRPA